MNPIKDRHAAAMDLAEQAFREQKVGRAEDARLLFQRACDEERLAADTIGSQMEPTRSVLYRSAATLAFHAGNTRDAEKLIAIALAGEPPLEIAEELRDLLEQVNFERHLSLRGASLSDGELQLSLAGRGVALGLIEGTPFFQRIQSIEKMVQRTVERKQKLVFRTDGPGTKETRERSQLYVSMPRPASFAITVRLGRPQEQLTLDGTDYSVEVVDEVLECLELFNSNDKEGLQDRIKDENYYNNFVALARLISPDGEAIQTVGLTSVSRGREHRVALRKSPSMGLLTPAPSASPVDKPLGQEIITGELRGASSANLKQGRVVIIDGEGRKRSVSVPPGLMGDIVIPLWEERVVVTALRHKKSGPLQLQDIRPVAAE